MKKIIIFITTGLLVVACQQPTGGQQESQETAKKEWKAENLQRVKINVEGMTCDGCERTVNGALEQLPGVKSATSSHEHGMATVKIDTSVTSMHQMMESIKETGYTVKGHEMMEGQGHMD
jgi:copper chaperone CopZ